MKQEAEKGITIKSTGVSMVFEVPDGLQHTTGGSPLMLVNLIDSPGHVDFSSEVTAALRVTDGALVVVDCVEGVCVQTETVVRQALGERIRPVLMLNKMDRVILELTMDPEEAYAQFAATVAAANDLIDVYSDGAMGDITLAPDVGNVIFGSGLHGWGFSLATFATAWADKFPDMTKDELMACFWGDHYYDRRAGAWQTHATAASNGKKLKRGFVQFVLDPLFALFTDACAAEAGDDLARVHAAVDHLGIRLPEEAADLTGRKLYKAVAAAWLPVTDIVLETMAAHLPPPHVAQAYRVDVLYDGPLDDECAEAIRTCDPNGPLMVYISKMIPNKNRFTAFGRVFSGTVTAGQKVRILGPDYTPGSTRDCTVKAVQRVVLVQGHRTEAAEAVPCGNTVGLDGIAQWLTKTGTLTTSADAHALKVMKFSVSPVVRVAVQPANPTELPRLIDGMRKLSKVDPCVAVSIDEESSEHIIGAAGELHMELCLEQLEEFAGIAIVASEPVVSFRETVIAATPEPLLAKSQNKHNRFWMSASPMGDDLVNQIEDGAIGPATDAKDRARALIDDHGWDASSAKKIWAFGPEAAAGTGTSTLVDETKAVQYLNEVRDLATNGFAWAAGAGPLCGEALRGVKFSLTDAQLHADGVHRRGAQVIPAVRRALNAAMLAAEPRLLEPVYKVEIQAPESAISGIYSTLAARRGQVVGQDVASNGQLYTVTGHLPVVESFGFTADLRSQTSGQAFPQCTFSHWEVVPGRHDEPGTRTYDLVRAIRARKGMTEDVPPVEHYADRL